MGTWQRVRWAALAGAAWCAAGVVPPSTAAPPAATGTEDAVSLGTAAPEDAWPMRDGCPARTSVSTARPLEGPLETTWTFETKGPIVGEPRAWKDRVFVVERVDARKQALHVVSLATGKALYRQTFETDSPLDPCVWGNRVVVRSRPNRIESFQVGERMLTSRWKTEGNWGENLSFFLFGSGLVVRSDRGIEKYDAEKKDPTWSVSGTFGQPSARGTSLVAIRYDKDGNGSLKVLDVAGGFARGEVFVAHHTGDASRPVTDPQSRVVLGRGFALVKFEEGIPLKSKDYVNTAWVDLEPLPHVRTLLSLSGVPVAYAESWVGFIPDGEKGLNLIRPIEIDPKGGFRYEWYARKGRHDLFLRTDLPPTVVGREVLLGTLAFDPQTRTDLREQDVGAVGRAIPLRDRLLVPVGDRRIACLRETRAAGGKAVVLPNAPAGAAGNAPIPLGPSVALLSGGRLVSGDLTFDSAGGLLRGTPPAKGKEAPSWPLVAVRAVIAKALPSRIHYAAGWEDVPGAFDALARNEDVKAWLDVAVEAARAGDFALARRVLSEAEDAGASEAALERAGRDIDPLEQVRAPLDPGRAEAAAAKARALDAKAAKAMGEAAAALPPEAASALRFVLLDAALERDPGLPPAVAWVRERLPKGVVAPEPLNARDWLLFLDAAARAPVSIVDPPKPGQPERELSYVQKMLGAARYSWRKDLAGVECGPLLLLSPLSKPGRIARCLALGHLVCSTLDAMFEGGTNRRDTRYPLVHHLYESKEEYLAESTKGEKGKFAEAARRRLARTAGHYDPDAELSRMYLPEGRQAFEEVQGTYVHELTHHWVEERCPMLPDRAKRRDGGMGAGHWVVEGIADFVEHATFDVRAGTASLLAPRSETLDFVAHAPTLNDWAMVYDGDRGDFRRLSAEFDIEVPLRWRMGMHQRVSALNLYYAQAGATFAWLWLAENGSRRDVARQFLVDHYLGRTGPGELSKRVGLPNLEIGRRVVAWCREITER